MRARLVLALLLAATSLVAGSPDGRASGTPEGPKGPTTQARPARSRPNVVVIMTDDQTVEQMRWLPYTRALIGSPGASFRTSLSSFPLCCPSRATFLTGQYAHNHGVLENDPPTGGYERLDAENTLPVWLRAAGYRTVHVGKFLNEYGVADPTEVPPGWDEWYGAIDPSTYRMWGYTLNENGRTKTYGDPGVENPALYQTDVYARKAVAAIHRVAHSDRPFFLNLWFLAPHREVDTLAIQTGPRPAPRHKGKYARVRMPRPPSFNEDDMTDKPLFMQLKPSLTPEDVEVIEDRYRNEIESLQSVDEAVRSVMRALAAEGVLRNTYVVFTSDNGYFHGEHRTPDEKILGYENSARVPLLIRGPGIRPGTMVQERVVNADLAPTIAELTGAEPTVTMDGRSFLPFLRRPRERTLRPILLEAFFPIGSAVTFFRQQLEGGGGGGGGGGGNPIPLGKTVIGYQGVRTERYAYLEYMTGERELYDLERDPFQLNSVHLDPAYAQTLAALTVVLEGLRLCSGEACRAETAPIPDPG